LTSEMLQLILALMRDLKSEIYSIVIEEVLPLLFWLI